MTAPTLTYGHGYLCDMDSATYWGAKTDSADPLTGVTLTSDGDVVEIEGTCDAAANEYVYYAYDMTNISSDTYPYITIRYRTSDSSNGLAVKVKLVFTAGTQTVLDAAYSTTWTEITVDITAAKTIDKVEIWADDTDAVAAGTFQVYYDFVLIHKGTFPFPAITNRTQVYFPNRHVDLEVARRVGDITQYLGASNIEIEFVGNMDQWGTWGSNPAYGQYLIENWLLSYTEPWQWLTCDIINSKVTTRNLRLGKRANDKSQRVWNLLLKTYSLSSGDNSDWGTLSWVGQ